MLPEGLQERFRELRRTKGLREDREAAVERVVYGTGPELWVPQVPLPPARNQPPPRLVDEPVRRGAEAGLDATGRPVLVRDAHGFRAWLLVWDGPRLEVVECDSHAGVSRVTWVDHDESGRPAQFATASTAYTELGEAAEIARCEWDGDRCARVRWHVNNDGREWHEGIVEAEYDERGLVRVREGSIATWQREFDAFEEDPLASDEALQAWVEAVAAAAGRVAERLGVADAVAIKVDPRFQGDSPSLVVVDRAYLAAADAREAIRQCSEPRHWFMREIDAAGLRALRSLRQQHVPDDEQPAAAEALMRRLAAMSRSGGAIPLVAGFTRDMWGLAARVLGNERLDVLPAARPVPAVERAPASVAELAGLIDGFGLPPHLVRQSAWGLVLEGRGRGRSRLGGRAELPSDMPWPAADDRALTHLATIVLSELPDFDGRDLLPAEGDLVFFADLTEEGELWEPVVVGEDDRVRIVHVAPGTRTHEPEPPAVLRRRKVSFRPVLTMPEEPEGLDAAQRLAYDQLREALVDVTPGLLEPGHLLLGHPEVVQYDSREPGQVSLLHMGWDEALGFEFLDGGDLTFYGDADDVQAGRWERLTVSPESC